MEDALDSVDFLSQRHTEKLGPNAFTIVIFPLPQLPIQNEETSYMGHD